MRNRIILHIDMDAFFASIEERENPQFRGKPVVVGADPKRSSFNGKLYSQKIWNSFGYANFKSLQTLPRGYFFASQYGALPESFRKNNKNS